MIRDSCFYPPTPLRKGGLGVRSVAFAFELRVEGFHFGFAVAVVLENKLQVECFHVGLAVAMVLEASFELKVFISASRMRICAKSLYFVQKIRLFEPLAAVRRTGPWASRGAR